MSTPRQQNSSERIEFLPASAFPGAELLVVNNSLRKWHIFHERYAFCAAQTADAGWIYRGKEHYSNDGSVMLLEPGETHRNTRLNKLVDFKVMLIPAELLAREAETQGARVTTHFRLASVGDPRLFKAIYRFCESVEARRTVLEQQCWFAACVRLFLEYAEQRPPVQPIENGGKSVEKAGTYLRERFAEPVTLDELSVVTGLSPFHLVRSFTKHFALPPHAYQIHVRIARATALLRAGVPCADVAARVGFADQSHFTRHFKRIWRTTPGSYARAA
jgi:AraC-like DNA-binding protein